MKALESFLQIKKNIDEFLHEKKRELHESFGNTKYSKPGAYDLDDKLAKYLPSKNGFYIETGANDGHSQSNTYYLEKFKGWKGVLIEALPHLYQKCQRLRPQSLVFNYALVSKDFPDSHIEMYSADLVSLVKDSWQDKEAELAHISGGANAPKITNPHSIMVPTKTLEAILDSIPNLPPIDFFSLDVEGYEMEVLKGLNLNKYKPKFILVETWKFPEIEAFLSEHYTFLEKLTVHDYLFKVKTSG